MRDGLITIILPTFNSTKIFDRLIFLEDPNFCILHRIEVIICDDSTNQDVFQRVNQIWHYQYLKHERTGNPVDNWNFGLDRATCKYTWLLHHDEFIAKKSHFLQIVEELKHSKKDFFFLTLNKLYLFGSIEFRPRLIRLLSLKYPKILYFANQLGSPSILIHRTTSERYNQELKWLVDVDFFVRILETNTASLLRIPIYSDMTMNESITQTIEDTYNLHIDELNAVRLSGWERFLIKILIGVKVGVCKFFT
jgi:glycosyltransferase involved in cell wall biosynthesis